MLEQLAGLVVRRGLNVAGNHLIKRQLQGEPNADVPELPAWGVGILYLTVAAFMLFLFSVRLSFIQPCSLLHSTVKASRTDWIFS